MKSRIPLLFLLLTFLLTGLLIACNSGQRKSVRNTKSTRANEKIFRLKNPGQDQFFAFSDSLLFEFSTLKNTEPDSVSIYYEGQLIHTETASPLSFRRESVINKVGRQNLRIKLFYDDSLSQTISLRLIILADEPPSRLRYELIKTLPHDPGDFIQGLFYYQGFLFEGTGHETRSRLIKTNPENGKIILERKLDDKYFGEGIARVDDKIYQLTYLHKIGFVYDLESFEKLREFDLQTLEGWGLTYDGENLIMSDGSSHLYFYNPISFILNNQLDAAHDKGLVNNLNELEYHEGGIWANVYGKTILVRIDASTGIVNAELDLEALYPRNLPHDYDHVLNGIAYNPDHDSYYVTGKYWPVMYEIRILE